MQYFKNIIFIFILLNTFQALSKNNFNIEPIEVSKNIYVFMGDNNDTNPKNGGAISNTAFIIGTTSILVIDAGPSYLYASKVIEIIKSYSSLPIRYLVVTHHHPDHSFGLSRFIENDTKIIMAQSEINRYVKYGNRLLKQLKNLRV